MTRLQTEWQKILRLPPRRWCGMAIVAWQAIRVERSLRHDPLPLTVARLGLALGSGDSRSARLEELSLSQREREKIDDVRKVLSRGSFNGTCLRQALLIGYLLRDRDPVIQVGVKKDGSSVRAHAWLTIDGVVIDDYGIRPTSAEGFLVMPLDTATIVRL